MMNQKTLFAAWLDTESHRWFPIGRLDVFPNNVYQFRYVEGMRQAFEHCSFEPLYDFPELFRVYRSAELFPFFKNRIMTPGRRDFQDYLRLMDLSGNPDPIEILSASGGGRATDTFEVFPKIEKREDGIFRCRFFLHGWRHLGEQVGRRIQELQPAEPLGIAVELTNPETGFAVQVQTDDYVIIGWAPRYLGSYLVAAGVQSTGEFGRRS